MLKPTRIYCSNCNKALMSIIITNPDIDVKHTISASCPFCNDKSFKTEINGVFAVGSILKEESKFPTSIKTSDMISDNETLFVIQKD